MGLRPCRGVRQPQERTSLPFFIIRMVRVIRCKKVTRQFIPGPVRRFIRRRRRVGLLLVLCVIEALDICLGQGAFKYK